jgi:hypothetical protein
MLVLARVCHWWQANGEVLKDIDAAATFEGRDVFYTEVWNNKALDGTHDWYDNGGVASYLPVVYDIQRVYTTGAVRFARVAGLPACLHVVTSPRLRCLWGAVVTDRCGCAVLALCVQTMAGSFQLRLDRTGVNLWGGRNTSTPISVSATEVQVKQALEAMPNVGKVTVYRNPLPTAGTYEWLITFTTQLGDVPELTVFSQPTTGTVAVQTLQQGITEVQVVRTSAIAPFLPERQTITTSAAPGKTLTGHFFVAFGNGVVPVRVDFNGDAAAMEAALESFPGIGDVLVTRAVGTDPQTNVS